jgi:hypothetical protein
VVRVGEEEKNLRFFSKKCSYKKKPQINGELTDVVSADENK